MNKLTVFAITMGVVLACLSHATQAHVLIRDTNKQIGAILHVSPDDDPIAGKPSELFFDIQGVAIDKNTKAKLTITGGQSSETVPTRVQNSGVQATYIFPTQGAYNLKLVIAEKSKTYTVMHAQRVTRGAITSTQTATTHTWAEFIFIFAACTLAILLIVGFNRRKDILEYSK